MLERAIRIGLIVITTISVSVVTRSQTFVDFPAGYSNKPSSRLKGPIHTVLTTEQRDEHVFSTTVEVYDEKGRITESLVTNANIEVHSQQLVRLGGKATFIYDSSGKLVRENNLDPEGKLYQYELYRYDDQSRLVEKTIFNAAGVGRGWHRYAYSPEKREVEVSWVFIYGDETNMKEPMRSILKYDKQFRWISRTFLGDTITFEYDQDGNFVREHHQSSSGGYGHTYAYKFDKYGNWIERLNTYFEVRNNKSSPNWMNEYRVITYYPEALIK